MLADLLLIGAVIFIVSASEILYRMKTRAYRQGRIDQAFGKE